MKKLSNYQQRGQVLLITLLVLAFAVTVAISVIARSTTNQAISNQMEDSAKAFSAAEAGIEQGMGAGSSSAETLSSGDAKYSVNVASLGGAIGVLTYPTTTRENTETVWLVNHAGDGTLDETPVYTTAPYIDVCWTKPGTVIPALVVSILYKRGPSYMIAKGAYDPNTTRVLSDKFSAPTSSNANSECGSGDYRARLTFAAFGINPANDTLLMLRLRPVYSDTTISVNSTVALPLQGKRVESVGTSTGGSTRKIVVYQQYRSADSFFDAALYSQANLVK